MSTELAAAEMFILTLAACACLSWFVCAQLAPRYLDHVEGWDPSRRHVALLFLAAAPWLLAGSLFLAVLSPSVASLFVPSLDHCLVHDDGHAHLCFVHLPHHTPHVAIWATLAVVLTLAAFAIGGAARRIVASQRAASALVRTTTAELGGVRVLEGNLPFCAAVGLMRPSIVVSRALLAGLSEAERHALIAHERSHVRRRDALTRVLGRALSFAYPSATRGRINEAVELSAEQACDEAAARAVGDRLTVAEAIVRTERMMCLVAVPPLGLVAVGMGAVAIERRVLALIDPPKSQGRLLAWFVPMLAVLTVLFLAGDSLHHAVESLLSPLLE